MSDWNAAQYLKFSNERTQPSLDLAVRIKDFILDPKKIVDIGCGPGNSTAVLKSRFPQAELWGVDNSPNMLADAKKNYPEIGWKLCDAATQLHTLDTDFDLVFSNACIQWVPNHSALLVGFMDRLSPGGVLAVQVPYNQNEPIHRILKQLALSERWQASFREIRSFYTLRADEYYQNLSSLSSRVVLWETIYYHILDSHLAILEWYRGTGLRPYLNQLKEEEKDAFEQDVLNLIRENYPLQPDGRVIFRFPRLFFIAVK